MPDRIAGIGPVRVPAAGVHQHRAAADFLVAEPGCVDGVDLAVVGTHHDAVEIGEGLRLDLRQVVTVLVAVERAAMQVPVLATISMRAMWNSVPASYTSREASRLR